MIKSIFIIVTAAYSGSATASALNTNAFIAELNSLLLKYNLPAKDLIVGGSVQSSSSQSTNGSLITEEEFNNAITGCGFNKTESDQYHYFVSGLEKADITTKKEAAMLLAQLIHESGGLKFKEEARCKEPGNTCAVDYPSVPGIGQPDKVYYPRGFIQMRYDYNYLAASKGLYGDDSLIQNPEKVANNNKTAWDVTFWYWKSFIHPIKDIQNGKYGIVSRILTQGNECNGKKPEHLANRNKYYAACLKSFGITETPDTSEC